MKTTLFILLILSLSTSMANVLAVENSLVVVVSKNNPIAQLSKDQVVDMFMGKYVAYPDGRKAKPLDLPKSSALKKDFYQLLVGMSISRINSYWSRIRFTGRASPPEIKASEAEVIANLVSSNSSIGYIYKTSLTDNLKVVYTFNE